MKPNFSGDGKTTHWSEFPGFGETTFQREIELSYRAGFGWAAGTLPSLDAERCETLIERIEHARELLRRMGPFRAAGLRLNHYLSRFVLAAHLRGQSHGLQYGRALIGIPYELSVWCDAVAEWSCGDPDCLEYPPSVPESLSPNLAEAESVVGGAAW